jgi:hypothetical protein
LTIALVSTASGGSFWSGWWKATMHGEFHPGPLWFLESLLLKNNRLTNLFGLHHDFITNTYVALRSKSSMMLHPDTRGQEI